MMNELIEDLNQFVEMIESDMELKHLDASILLKNYKQDLEDIINSYSK